MTTPGHAMPTSDHYRLSTQTLGYVPSHGNIAYGGRNIGRSPPCTTNSEDESHERSDSNSRHHRSWRRKGPPAGGLGVGRLLERRHDPADRPRKALRGR